MSAPLFSTQKLTKKVMTLFFILNTFGARTPVFNSKINEKNVLNKGSQSDNNVEKTDDSKREVLKRTVEVMIRQNGPQENLSPVGGPSSKINQYEKEY